MTTPIEQHWKILLESLKSALEKNHFEAFIVSDRTEAKALAVNEIIPKLDLKSISWGGSDTYKSTGLYEELKNRQDVEIIDIFDRSLSRPEMLARRRQSLQADLFITGTNALTACGKLVNLDNLGNRVSGITFGPKNVLIFAGRNKITADLDAAMDRVKHVAAPINAVRLGKKTPCVKTGRCEDCSVEGRLCNTWTITEKSFPKGRIKVILINEDLGF